MCYNFKWNTIKNDLLDSDFVVKTTRQWFVGMIKYDYYYYYSNRMLVRSHSVLFYNFERALNKIKPPERCLRYNI